MFVRLNLEADCRFSCFLGGGISPSFCLVPRLCRRRLQIEKARFESTPERDHLFFPTHGRDGRSLQRLTF